MLIPALNFLDMTDHIYDEPQLPEPLYEQVLTCKGTTIPSIEMNENDAYSRKPCTQNITQESHVGENIGINTISNTTMTMCPAYIVIDQ